MAYTRTTICAKCGKPLPPGRVICPCRGDLCGHVWDFRGLDHDEDGKKYFRYTCLRCGERRVEPVSTVQNMYAAKLDAE